MPGLTLLGLIHTVIGLVAVGAGVVAFTRDGAIEVRGTAGRWFLWATVLTCVTGFFIFRHGGFGPPHALGVLTLAVVLPATWAQRIARERGAPSYFGTVGFSFAFFLHFIPGVTETFTRLPVGDPWFNGPEDPALQAVIGVLFALFLAGAAWQVQTLRSRSAIGQGLAALTTRRGRP